MPSAGTHVGGLQCNYGLRAALYLLPGGVACFVCAGMSPLQADSDAYAGLRHAALGLVLPRDLRPIAAASGDPHGQYFLVTKMF